jgi:hypothetical protein
VPQEPSPKSHVKPALDTARDRNVDRKDEKPQWQHPDSKNRQKAEQPSEDERDSKNQANDKVSRHWNFATEKTDLAQGRSSFATAQ